MRHRLERIGLVIGIVLTIIIVAGVVNYVQESDQGPLEPTQVPTEEPTVGPTQIATPSTPEATFDPDPDPRVGSLIDMLGYSPDRLQDDSLPLSDIARYADIETWMTLQGVEIPEGPTDPAWNAWQAELESLALPEVLAARGADPIWRETYGFGLNDVHQVLAVGSAPDYVMVVRGDFSSDTLHATWAENGYQAVRVNGVTYWSLYPGGAVDLSAPASRPALGNMNNLVLLEDGTLIATARSGRLEQTIRTVQGTHPSLADNAAMQTLLAPGTSPESIITAVLLKGSVLEQPIETNTPAPFATPVAGPPQAKMMLVGLQSPPQQQDDASMVIVAVYDSADDAVRAQQRAATTLATDDSSVTNAPFADRMHARSMRVIAATDGESLLLIQLSLTSGSADWLEIVEDRDFGFIMWPRLP